MTLPDRILLINDLIREDREATVRDYIKELRAYDAVERIKGKEYALDLYAKIHKAAPVISGVETTYKKAK